MWQQLIVAGLVFLLKILFFNYEQVCTLVSASLCSREHSCPLKPEALDPSVAGVTGGCESPGTGIGTTLGSSGRAVLTLNRWTIYPAPMLVYVIPPVSQIQSPPTHTIVPLSTSMYVSNYLSPTWICNSRSWLVIRSMRNASHHVSFLELQ